MNETYVVTQQGSTANNRDRVRAHTAEDTNRTIDESTHRCVEQLSGADREQITRHIDDVSREWDTERYLQTNASILALSGVLLGSTVNRKFLILPAVVFGFFFQHAVQGWCPPLPVFRKLGVRTRKEINREKYALKALRGDFDAVAGESDESDAERVDRAVESSTAQ
jgi:hypothetical protein